MNQITRAALGLTAAGALAMGALPATAHAQGTGSITPSSSDLPGYLIPGPDTLVTPTGSPTGLCAGAVAAHVRGSGYPDSATMSWGIALPGVGPCDLTVTLHWQNLDTGASGETSTDVPGPRLWTGVEHPHAAIVSTGPGRVEYRLTTDAGAQAGPIIVETEAYEY